MKFPYVRYGTFYRPIVPITFTVDHARLTYEMLIDTGADHSVVHTEIAETLGITKPPGTRVEVAGIAGSTMGFVAKVNLELGSAKLPKVPIIFADLGPQSFGILGHAGCFDRLRLIFEFSKRQFEIIPK